jgi:competence protein ComEC
MEFITNLINSYLPEPHASLLLGIVLGKKLEVTASFYQKLKDVGLIHIVVLSGMNITLLSSLVISTTVEFIGRRYATILTIVIIILFILFVGIEPPLMRASIMGILSLIGLLYGRKTLALYTLFLSGCLMIIIWPDWLTSISFQLSFAATLGIILFGNAEKESRIIKPAKTTRHPELVSGSSKIEMLKRVQHDVLSYIDDELRVTLSAQVFTVPLIFFYFRQLSFVAPLANILISFIIAPLMVLGLITIAVGTFWWTGGFIISWFCYVLLEYLIQVIEHLSNVPYASVTF